jgi:YVTN family beta-propeller protein
MTRILNPRLLVAVALVFALAVWVLAREQRPSLLRPDLRLHAYVANTGNGTLSIVDLPSLAVINTIEVGPRPSGVRAHPTRDEIWGVSSTGGYAWVVDARQGSVTARIPVGEGAYALDFSPDGRRAFVAASRSGFVTAIDCETKQVRRTMALGQEPWLVRVTPDGHMLAVPQRAAGRLALLEAETLATLAIIPVAERPEHVVILPDSSKAFVSAAGAGQVSVVDLRARVLLTNLPLGSTAAAFMLKPDGGELFVSTPDQNSLTILNTWTNEVTETVIAGDRPASGTMGNDEPHFTLYLSDRASGQVRPFVCGLRRLLPPIQAGRSPGASRLTPDEELLLVVNEESDDLAVIRVRTQSLLTLIPVGPAPRDLAIKLFSTR